jgi:hypothetical protein
MDDSKAVDSLDYLRSVMMDETASENARLRAAIALAQYEHTKTHDGGKKESAQKVAEGAASGKFAPARPPLKLVNS